jgi:hypothetical protein
MRIGKQTLTQSTSAQTAHKLDPHAAVQMRIDRASLLLRELREEHVPALRAAIEQRALDAATSSDVLVRRELAEVGRELRNATRLARTLEDEVSTERAARLHAELSALSATAQPWLELAPAGEPVPEIVLIAHVPGDAQAYRAEQAERERTWCEKLDRAAVGIADLTTRRDRNKDRR